MQPGLKMLTDFGDSALLLPLAIVLTVWLLATRPLVVTLAWLLTLIAANGLIGLSKIYFLGCPARSPLHSPSGHTGFSILVYGGLTIIAVSATRSRRSRAAIVTAGACLVAAIAISRIALGLHNTLEVVLGALIGSAGLTVFSRVYRQNPGRGGWLAPLAIVVLICAVIFHGHELNIEAHLLSVAASLGIRHPACG
jgi:membrane-associated phospholipid phosphatase